MTSQDKIPSGLTHSGEGGGVAGVGGATAQAMGEATARDAKAARTSDENSIAILSEEDARSCWE